MSVSNGPGCHGLVLLGASAGTSFLSRPRILYILSFCLGSFVPDSVAFYLLLLVSVAFFRVFDPGHVTLWSLYRVRCCLERVFHSFPWGYRLPLAGSVSLARFICFPVWGSSLWPSGGAACVSGARFLTSYAMQGLVRTAGRLSRHAA